MGYKKELVSMQGIDYKEIVMYLEGEISLDESMEKMNKQGTKLCQKTVDMVLEEIIELNG